ncbi:MAG: SoxR reducing system RseC family protein, partial [bacterium]|nr:SoxR reducing system RseC family protein [bacterium]
ESGVVSRVEADKVWVRVVKGEKCEGCKACGAFGEGSAEMMVMDHLSVQKGDRVEVEIDPTQVVRHSSIVFLLPVLGLVLGYFLGANYLIKLGLNVEAAGIVGSLGLMVLSFGIIFLYDKAVGKNHAVTAKITRILNQNKPNQ